MRTLRSLAVISKHLATVAVLVLSTNVAAEPILGLTLGNQLIQFDSTDPTLLLSTVSIQGLAGSESLRGIDVRPRDGKVYGVVTTANGEGRLVLIDPGTGATSTVATLIAGGGSRATGGGSVTIPAGGNAVLPATARLGLDFNPVVDLLRVVGDEEFNGRINPGNRMAGGVAGTTATDIALTVTATGQSGPVDAVATAYSNNRDGVASTMQFVIDAAGDRLFVQAPPNTGTLSAFLGTLSFGGVTVDVLDAGFDISGFSATAFSVLSAVDPALFNLLFTVNLGNASLTSLGRIGGSTFTGQVIDIAALSVPEPATLALFGAGLAGLGLVRRRTKSKAGR
jgi:Domain of unknown function (DUF4394)/PEP-CTERM motif